MTKKKRQSTQASKRRRTTVQHEELAPGTVRRALSRRLKHGPIGIDVLSSRLIPESSPNSGGLYRRKVSPPESS